MRNGHAPSSAAVAFFGMLLLMGCAPRIHIATELVPPDPVSATDGFRARFRISVDTIHVSIANLGDQPIEVLWQKTSIVDTSGNAWDVAHGGGRTALGSKDLAGEDVSRIPPQSTLNDILMPRGRLSYDGGWSVQPFVPVECGPLRCIGYENLAGETIRLNMTLRIGDEDRVFDWTFRITRVVRSVAGARPKDPELSAALK